MLLTETETQKLKNAGFLIREFAGDQGRPPRVQIGGVWNVFPDEVDERVRSTVDVTRLKWSYSGSDPMLRTKFLVFVERQPRQPR